jgi:arylsulfatase
MGEPIPGAPGKSLVPGFQKDVVIERDSLWWLHEGNRAVRVGDWKLVAAKGQPWELYDLKNDRAEQKNLAAELPAKVAELEKVWQSQTAGFTDLARATAAEQPKAGKRKAAH